MKTWWTPGDWNALCDQCGRKFKSSMLRKRWDGMMVCEQDWETRHPQEFVRSVRDNHPLPWTRTNIDVDALGNPRVTVAPTLNCALLNYTYPAKVTLEIPGAFTVRKVSVAGPLTINGDMTVECTLEVT